MEISILLAEQILAMFLTMAVGFGVVRAGVFCVYSGQISMITGRIIGLRLVVLKR